MALKALLVILLLETASGHGFGSWSSGYHHFQNSGYSYGRSSFRSTPATWLSDWAVVSDVFSPAPPAKLDVKWRDSRLVSPGDSIPVTVMTSKPTNLRWTSERGAL